MYRLFLNISLLAFIAVSWSCKDSKSDKKENILAEYKGRFLYSSDIPRDVWNQYLKGDSSGLLKSIVNKWLENAVLVNEAEKSLSDAQKDKQKLIEDYRNSLLIYEYHQQLIREKLDTGVTDQEIIAFYNNNNAAFQLKKNIVKIKYLKFNRQNADPVKIKKLMQGNGADNEAKLKDFAEKQAINFYIDSNWLYLDDITKEIPLDENYNQQRFLANNKFVSIEEKGIVYLLYITDFRIKDALSPLEFERDKIKEIILYQRKLQFLKDIQSALYDKAIENGEIKFYLNKK